MITLRNNFHGTSVRVRVNPGEYTTNHQYRRIRRELCGKKNCGCGVVRGPQYNDDRTLELYVIDTTDFNRRGIYYVDSDRV